MLMKIKSKTKTNRKKRTKIVFFFNTNTLIKIKHRSRHFSCYNMIEIGKCVTTQNSIGIFFLLHIHKQIQKTIMYFSLLCLLYFSFILFFTWCGMRAKFTLTCKVRAEEPQFQSIDTHSLLLLYNFFFLFLLFVLIRNVKRTEYVVRAISELTTFKQNSFTSYQIATLPTDIHFHCYSFYSIFKKSLLFSSSSSKITCEKL